MLVAKLPHSTHHAARLLGGCSLHAPSHPPPAGAAGGPTTRHSSHRRSESA